MTESPVEPVWLTLLKAGYRRHAKRKLRKKIEKLTEEMKRDG